MEVIFVVSLVAGVVLLLFLRAKGAAIRKAAKPSEPRLPPNEPISGDDIIAWLAGGAAIATMLPGLAGLWLLAEDAMQWLRTASWQPRQVSAFFDPNLVRSSSLAGWNKMVEWAYAQPAWLAGILTSIALYFGLLTAANAYQERNADRQSAAWKAYGDK
jgi:hypothetical protein